MSFQDVIKNEKLEYLGFNEFWPIFCCSLSDTDDALESFFWVLDNGVKLRYSSLGYGYDDQFAHKGDIKVALTNIIRRKTATMDKEVKTYQYGLDTSPSPHGPVIPVGELLIKRSDIRQVYSECGYSQYPWAIEPGNITEWKWFPVDVADGKVKAVKNDKVFNKRLAALKAWLISLDYTLRDKVIILPKHYTLEVVYTELGKKNPDLFANIELSSFDSHFWGKQKIVELMRGNKSAIL